MLFYPEKKSANSLKIIHSFWSVGLGLSITPTPATSTFPHLKATLCHQPGKVQGLEGGGGKAGA